MNDEYYMCNFKGLLYVYNFFVIFINKETLIQQKIFKKIFLEIILKCVNKFVI